MPSSNSGQMCCWPPVLQLLKLVRCAGRARNPQRLQPAASFTPKADPATPPVWATHEPGCLEWRIEAASALADIMLCGEALFPLCLLIGVEAWTLS